MLLRLVKHVILPVLDHLKPIITLMSLSWAYYLFLDCISDHIYTHMFLYYEEVYTAIDLIINTKRSHPFFSHCSIL